MVRLAVLSAALALGASWTAPAAWAQSAPVSIPSADSEASEVVRLVAGGDVAKARDALLERIRRQASSLQAAGMAPKLKALVATPAFAKTVVRHRFLVEADDAKLAELAASPEGKELLAILMADTALLDMLMTTGIQDGRAADTFGVLLDIYKADKQCVRHPLHRKLALGIACSFGSAKSRDRIIKRGAHPVPRYTFYRDAHKAGRLHAMFDKFEPWEMRYLGSTITDDASLPWLLDHVNIPLERYTDACWMAEYRGSTIFGGWVHAEGFYYPWAKSQGHEEGTYRHGGVCGALSHYGAASAAAHGIPSLPMGQPGHCAYGVRFARNDWRGGFGGPYGGSHHNILDNIWEHTDILFLAEKFMGDTTRLVESRRMAWVAGTMQDADKAKAAYIAALANQPLNAINWHETVKWLAANELPSAWYEQFASQAGASLAPEHAYTAMEFVRRLEEPYRKALKREGKPDGAANLPKLWASAVRAGAPKGFYGWQRNDYWKDMLRRLGKDTEARGTFVRQLVAASKDDAGRLADIIGWAQENLDAGPEQLGALNLVTKALAASNGKEGAKEGQRGIFQKMILLAAKSGSMPAFNSLSKMGAEHFDKEDEQHIKRGLPNGLELPPEAQLRSAGGILVASSTSGWDRPLLHASALTPKLGFFHTAGGKEQWVTAQLPKLTEPSEIVLVMSEGNQNRAFPLKLSVSEDGKSWTPVWTCDRYAPFWKIGLAGKGLRARHVKVERTGDNGDVFHMRGLLVYGRLLQ